MIDNFHNRPRKHMRRLKNRLTLAVGDAVIGFNRTRHIFFHDVLHRWQMIVEFMQLRFIFQLVGRVGADAVVRLDDDRIARLCDKRQSRFPL